MASAWDHIDIAGSLDRGRQRGARRAVEIYLDQGDYGAAADAMTPYDPQGATAIRRIEDDHRKRQEEQASRSFDRELAPLLARNDIEGAQRLAVERKRPSAQVLQLMEIGQKLEERERERIRRQSIDTMYEIRRMRDLPPAEAQQRYSALRQRLVSETPALANNLPEAYSPEIAKDLMERSQAYGEALSYLQAQMEREGMRTLTPQEATGMGFRPGTVVQQKSDGSLNVLQNPASNDGGTSWRPMTPEELGAYNLPVGTSALIDDNGNVKRLTGPRQYTEGQSAAASFAARARAAIIELRAAESDPRFNINDTLNPTTTNPAAQRWLGAARDLINAQLRRESGAAIGASEFESARRQYLSNPLDFGNADVRKAKYDRLNNLYRAFREQSAGAYDEWYGEPGSPENPLMDVSRGRVSQRPNAGATTPTPGAPPPRPPNVPPTAKWDASRNMWVP